YVEERRSIDRPLIQAAIAELRASGVLSREAQTCGVADAIPGLDAAPQPFEAPVMPADVPPAVNRVEEVATPEPAHPEWEERPLLSDGWEAEERIAAAVSGRERRPEPVEQTLVDSPERLAPIASPIFDAPAPPARSDQFWHRIFRLLGGEPALRS